MPIRALTDEELEQIKVAKDVANSKLRERREEIKKALKRCTVRERKLLQESIEEHGRVRGKPIIAVINEAEICIDYETIKLFTKKLDKNHLYELRVGESKSEPAVLIAYWPIKGTCQGSAAIFGLHPRQRDLLSNLPKVDITQH